MSEITFYDKVRNYIFVYDNVHYINKVIKGIYAECT